MGGDKNQKGDKMMFEKMVNDFREKICRNCNDNDKCQKKTAKMSKCGILYLVINSEIGK